MAFDKERQAAVARAKEAKDKVKKATDKATELGARPDGQPRKKRTVESELEKCKRASKAMKMTEEAARRRLPEVNRECQKVLDELAELYSKRRAIGA
jgi:SMC interacting uncharacterized protein involved in chromosome segregation